MPIIGRDDEIESLSEILTDEEPHLLAVYGRRRIGKTFLIRNFFEKQIAFEISGLHNASQQEQLENFTQRLALAKGKRKIADNPQTWIQAFQLLVAYLEPLLKKGKKIVFFDEFPWMDTPRSGFMQAFENFWNTWASSQKKLIVIICGSAAAWMIRKVVNNKGGLHNRITRRMRLLPFTLQETEAYLQHRNINLDRYQILQLYMAMGGVPHYLKEIKRGESAIQAIDRICFKKDGLLTDEFKNLYTSLFDNASSHTAIINALAKKPGGLTRNDILKASKLSSGGGFTQIIEELTESGFITAYIPFGKTIKDSLYKLTDEYSLFYMKFITGSKISGAGTWTKVSATPSWKSWSGYAYESVCMKHMRQIKKALGISGIHSEVSAWHNRGKDEKGAQIDLLIDRNDRTINACEIKFSGDPFEITKAYKADLENKVRAFKFASKTRKTVFLTMITTYGVRNIENFAGFINNEIKMDALFKK